MAADLTGATAVELFEELAWRADDRRTEAQVKDHGEVFQARHAGREFSLAITYLEEAQMRFTRGLAMQQGVFAPRDLEKPAPESAR